MKRDRVKTRLILIVIWIATLSAAVILCYDYSIKNVGFYQDQPIQFSHKTHSEKFEIKCLFCHKNAEDARFSPVPPVSTCMQCHIGLKTKQDITASLQKHWDSLQPIEWNRIYNLPDYVHFPHNSHLHVQIDCSSCHGRVETSDTVQLAQALTMSWCLNCHRNPLQNIVFARDLSGIYTSTDSLEYFQNYQEGKPYSYPAWGMWQGKLTKPLSDKISTPRKPVRGAENCSACHY